MKRTCKQCGKEFIITQSEINFYKSKNLSIPKRCKECRQSNKQNKGTAQASVADSYKSVVQKTSAGNHIPEVTNASQATNSPQVKKGPMPKIVTAVLAVLALVYAIFFGKDSGQEPSTEPAISPSNVQTQDLQLEFRNEELLNDHYEKHGIEMGFSSAEAYEDAAEAVVEDRDALSKTEAEDGDMVYYLEETNEFVIVSPDGYIRTYFCPEDGIDYYNRQ